jgi:sodium-dependent phosphate cotransporter
MTHSEAEQLSARSEIPWWVRLLFVLALLYLFLAGVKGLESGIGALGSGFTDSLFQGVSNPLAGLFVGVLATVLVQSSSVTTATIVGLVGAGTLTVEAAVPMVMGANIGTTVTNTLASLGYLRRSAEFRRAFAGATMHDFFNILAVTVLLPLEIATKFLSRTATWLGEALRGTSTGIGESESPIRAAIKLPIEAAERILDASGAGDTITGIVLLTLGLGMILIALAAITRNMRLLLLGRIERSMNALLGRGAGLPAMAIGIVITVAVQSSSITTSVLIPMIAAGVLTLRNAFPVTLGANLGTTVTALLASLATDRPEGLAIALAHTLFNGIGILLIYPFPKIRYVPVILSERLAAAAEVRKSMVLAYVAITFVLIPLVGVLVLR